MNELPYRMLGNPHRDGHVRMGAAVESGAHQCTPLTLRETCELRDRGERPRAVQDRLLERLTGDVDLIERYIDSWCCFGRGVTHNLVQPPTQVPDLGARPEGRERAQEGLLEEIFCMPI
jgi:hypothetical protein